MLTGYLKTDQIGRTSIEGVYAAGDSTPQAASLANSIASGSMAGAGANAWLATSGFFAAQPVIPR